MYTRYEGHQIKQNKQKKPTTTKKNMTGKEILKCETESHIEKCMKQRCFFSWC